MREGEGGKTTKKKVRNKHKAKISLRKHFRFLSRASYMHRYVMDCSPFDYYNKREKRVRGKASSIGIWCVRNKHPVQFTGYASVGLRLKVSKGYDRAIVRERERKREPERAGGSGREAMESAARYGNNKSFRGTKTMNMLYAPRTYVWRVYGSETVYGYAYTYIL